MDWRQGRSASGPTDAVRRYPLDVLLVRRARAGDRRHVALLVRRLAGLKTILHGLNRRMGSPLDRDDIDDVHQEVWVRIWTKLDSYEGSGSLEAWARGFSVFVYMNRLRRADRERELERRLLDERLPPASSDRGDRFVGKLERLLEDLGAPEAEIVRSKLLSNVSFARIARDLEIPLGTAKSRYYRGLTWLRTKLP